MKMPVHSGKDSKGTYYQWGHHGKKYYGKDGRAKAEKQGRAIKATGWKEKNKKIIKKNN